jgi:hypothetical protein
MIARIRPLFTTMQWLTIVGGIIVTIMSWTAFAFTTFEQKSDLRDVLSEINNRLGRIESAVRR